MNDNVDTSVEYGRQNFPPPEFTRGRYRGGFKREAARGNRASRNGRTFQSQRGHSTWNSYQPVNLQSAKNDVENESSSVAFTTSHGEGLDMLSANVSYSSRQCDPERNNGAIAKTKSKLSPLAQQFVSRSPGNVYRGIASQNRGIRNSRPNYSKLSRDDNENRNLECSSTQIFSETQNNGIHESSKRFARPPSNVDVFSSDRISLLQHVSNTFNVDNNNATPNNRPTPCSDINGESRKSPTQHYKNDKRYGGGRGKGGYKNNIFQQGTQAYVHDDRTNFPDTAFGENGISRTVRKQKFREELRRDSMKSRDEDSLPQSSEQVPLSFRKSSTYKQKRVKEDDDTSQRDCLIEQLTHNSCECMVCCDRIKTQDPIWSCQNCYQVFHLRCIRQWARSPAAIVEDAGWRCPACQHVTEKVPNQYRCFCGKMREPEWNRYDTPHSCGEQCGKPRPQKNCTHRCNIPCHPGPCPPCQVQVTRTCECGKTSQPGRCGASGAIVCEKECQKLLNCGIHVCQRQCHSGACSPCPVVVQQMCFCGKSTKEVPCIEETANQKFFSCGSVCNKLLCCGHHSCNVICHSGPCAECQLVPEMVTQCQCGQTPLNDILPPGKERTSCTDPIPVCGKPCSKVLGCGPPDNPHTCSALCHAGICPPCPLVTTTKCRCGQQILEVPCSQLGNPDALCCQRKCNKKKNCSRHKCLQKCCVDEDHQCSLLCNRKLTCGLHTCEEPCHRGNCPLCWHTSFDELACHCGAAILFPPIPCGTKPPDCKELCARSHACGHPVMHNCHSEEKCPPCTYLTEKWCYGKHELRSNVPCYLVDISCGRPCNKPLPCGLHTCQLICHAGPCLKANESCTQPCTLERALCGHPCSAPCHDKKPCPNISCKTKVAVTCQCGHLSEKITCAENLKALQRQAMSAMASRLSGMQAGQCVDISDIVKTPAGKNRRLECNDECALIERNRRLALALQIRNPELTNKLGPPTYSDFLRDQMKQNPTSVTTVYTRLTEVVQNAKQSKQKSRSYAFPPMNREQRRLVHELAEFFGCETVSYDEEPKKNVVITALRDKSWLPSVSLMTVVERESVHRKAPPPIPHKSQLPSKSDSSESSKLTALEPAQASCSSKEAVIDYFDYNPES